MLPLRIAARYFRSGGSQTVLTVMGVAVGVAVFVFISALIGGLQKGLIDRVIGSLSQVTAEPVENEPRTWAQFQAANGGAGTSVTKVQRVGDREPKISGWQPLVAYLDKEPGVTAVSPSVVGPAVALRGNQIRSITLRGIVPDRASGIVDIRGKLVAGSYDVSGQNCLIGVELADRLGVGVKDKIRVRSGKGRERVMTVAGIFDVGIVEINERSFYLSLTNAQRLLDLVGYVTSVEMKIGDVFAANDVADHIHAETGLKVDSWMRQNKEFLAGLRGQSGSSTMIKTFVMLSVAFGIASVLAVTVTQKSREIGILKSMGARTGSVMGIVVWLGLMVSLLGSVIGVGLGFLLVWLFTLIPGRTFDILFSPEYVVQAVATAVIVGATAGIFPARRAATVDPVEVIRYG